MDHIRDCIAVFGTALTYNDIPDAIRTRAKAYFLDTIGVILAGTRDPICKPVFSYLDEVDGRQDATILGFGRRASISGAAFANGVFGHVEDYDDTNHLYFSHQSIAIVPAILALSEKHQKSGRDIITAYAIGTEVQWRLGDALVIKGDHYDKGWHATATLGAFGAAAAASKLLDLGREPTAQALGIVASEASGIQAQFGTQSKAFQAGRANEAGLRAALLARAGFTSSPNALEDKVGFINLVADTYDLSKLGGAWRLGETVAETGQMFKAHPICGAGNGVVEAVLVAREENQIDVKQVAKIECTARAVTLKYLTTNKPSTGLEAKFNIPYWIASPLVYGKLGMPETANSAVTSLDIQELIDKTVVIGDEQVRQSVTQVKLFMKNGQSVTAKVGLGKGSRDDPMTEQEVIAKFLDCALWAGLEADSANALVEEILKLDQAPNLNPLLKLCIAQAKK